MVLVNDGPLQVPDAALPFIAMHRTHSQGDLKTRYGQDVARGYALIKPHLPVQGGATLDIGCGMAGTDAGSTATTVTR